MTNAIATLLFTQSYLPGVIVLGKTLKQFGLPDDTKLVVLLATQLTPFQKTQLEEIFDELIDTTLIHAPVSKQLISLDRPELSPTYSKINLFKLTQFNTVLYLDADTLPLKPFTEKLFEDYGDIGQHQIVAAPDAGWPDIFNSGLFLFKPSIETYLGLLNKIQHTENPSFDGADQGLLNEYFHLDNGTSNDGWVRLPFLYNVTPTGQYEYQPAYNYFHDQINLVHFIGNIKPWENSHVLNGLKDQWWSKFHEFYGKNGSIEADIHGIRPLYYTPEKTTRETVDVTPQEYKPPQQEPVYEIIHEQQHEHVQERHDEEYKEEEHHTQHSQQYVQQTYEEANNVLLDPRSYEHFETVEPDPHHWNPAVEEPPKDGIAQAADLPQDFHSYANWNDDTYNRVEEHIEEPTEHHTEHAEQHTEQHTDNHIDHHIEEFIEQPTVEHIEETVEEFVEEYHPPPIFPWEFEKDQAKAERVFDNDSYGGYTGWDALPLIRKIQASQHHEEEEETIERRKSFNEEQIQAKFLEDQKDRLKEIEDRYSGDIQILEDELEEEIDEAEERALESVTPAIYLPSTSTTTTTTTNDLTIRETKTKPAINNL